MRKVQFWSQTLTTEERRTREIAPSFTSIVPTLTRHQHTHKVLTRGYVHQQRTVLLLSTTTTCVGGRGRRDLNADYIDKHLGCRLCARGNSSTNSNSNTDDATTTTATLGPAPPRTLRRETQLTRERPCTRTVARRRLPSRYYTVITVVCPQRPAILDNPDVNTNEDGVGDERKRKPLEVF